MLGLYSCAELASSRRDLKEKWEEIGWQKSTGAEAILFTRDITHMRPSSLPYPCLHPHAFPALLYLPLHSFFVQPPSNYFSNQ